MSSILLLIRNIAPAVYLMAGLGVVWGFRLFMAGRTELVVAQFRLERENAEELAGRGISLVVVCVQIIVLVWLVSHTTYDAWLNLGLNEQKEEESLDRFQTAIPLEVGGNLQVPTRGAEGPDIVRTQPPSPTPAGTLRSADAPTGCIFDQAFIDIPDNGQVIFEVQPIIGTASIQDFAYYRFEIREVGSGGQFGVIGGAESDYPIPVVDGPLGQVIPQNFAPGEYRFRLVVFDTGGRDRATCEITIFISEPLPTPTPIGADLPAGIPAPATTQAP